jgi:hypothetical protein
MCIRSRSIEGSGSPMRGGGGFSINFPRGGGGGGGGGLAHLDFSDIEGISYKGD